MPVPLASVPSTNGTEKSGYRSDTQTAGSSFSSCFAPLSTIRLVHATTPSRHRKLLRACKQHATFKEVKSSSSEAGKKTSISLATANSCSRTKESNLM
ncbi:unnamed protein product [Lampetra planeri]